MARWLLKQAHYLNVPGTEWEQVETSRDTGKQGRHRYIVPLYLDPANSGDCNYPEGVIVAHEGSKFSRDIIFIGKPTPDMQPLDDEAEAISAKHAPEWLHPIESLPGQGGDYGKMLVDQMEKQIQALIRIGKAEPANPVSVGSVDREEFKKLQEQVGALMARNAVLEAASQPKGAVARRA